MRLQVVRVLGAVLASQKVIGSSILPEPISVIDGSAFRIAARKFIVLQNVILQVGIAELEVP